MEELWEGGHFRSNKVPGQLSWSEVNFQLLCPGTLSALKYVIYGLSA